MGATLTIGPAIRMQADRLTFPGMLPREVCIFRAWLKLHESEFDNWDFNYRIGAGHDPGPMWPDYVRQQAISVSQFRIDAVAYKLGLPTLIEVKDRAGASAVGQLVSYEALWEQAHPAAPPPALILVTNRVQPNILPLIQKNQIRLDQVPCDFSPLQGTTKAYVPGY